MIYLLDGSNLLGSRRHEIEAQRELARACASFARARRIRVICFFDGTPTESFADKLGAVSLRFASPRTADELIVAEVERNRGQPMRVVTSDVHLGARVKGGRVELVRGEVFLRELESGQTSGQDRDVVDWEVYFSDPKNRNV